MIHDWINAAFTDAHVTASRLSPSEVSRLVKAILERYTSGAREKGALWEWLRDSTGRRRSDGWMLMCDYPHQPVNMLFHEKGSFHGYRFDSSDDLRAVLRESPGFECYIANDEVSYVLCHNHHDFLIGVGECTGWLATLEDDAH